MDSPYKLTVTENHPSRVKVKCVCCGHETIMLAFKKHVRSSPKCDGRYKRLTPRASRIPISLNLPPVTITEIED